MMGRAFLRRGYSLFAVSHLSQPKATIPEIYHDVTRAVQHIRVHAGEYGVDPGQLGVVGASAGGHLSLMVATRGKETTGKAGRARPRGGDLFPVTDVLKPGNPDKTENDGGPSKRFRKLFGSIRTTSTLGTGSAASCRHCTTSTGTRPGADHSR